MRRTAIIVGTLLVAMLLVLGACTPTPAPPTSEPELEFDWNEYNRKIDEAGAALISHLNRLAQTSNSKAFLGDFLDDMYYSETFVVRSDGQRFNDDRYIGKLSDIASYEFWIYCKEGQPLNPTLDSLLRGIIHHEGSRCRVCIWFVDAIDHTVMPSNGNAYRVEAELVKSGPQSQSSSSPTPTPAPPLIEGKAAEREFANIQSAVHSVIVDNELATLPNPVVVATSDMSAFPDATSACGVDKIFDSNGSAYRYGDKNGYVLYQHDRIADGLTTGLANYVSMKTTTYWYTVDAAGTVTQWTTPPTALTPTTVPATFSVSNLAIQPTSVQTGDIVTVTIDVTNTGGKEGSYAISLKINGAVVDTKEIILTPGRSTCVPFSVSKRISGIYSVDIDSLKGTFVVTELPVLVWTYPEIQHLGTSGDPDFFHETVPREVLENPEWEPSELERKVTELAIEYEKANPYVEPSHVCRHMAVEFWQVLKDNNITSLIVLGNTENQEEWRINFGCNHAWILVLGRNNLNLGVECTNGTVYSPVYMRNYELDCEQAYQKWGQSSPQWASAKAAYDRAYTRYEQYLEGYFYRSPTAFYGSCFLFFAPWNW